MKTHLFGFLFAFVLLIAVTFEAIPTPVLAAIAGLLALPVLALALVGRR